MNWIRKALTITAVLVTATLWALVTGDRIGAALSGFLAFFALFRRDGMTVSIPAQAILLVVCGMVAAGWSVLSPGTGGLADRELGRSWPTIGGGALLLAAVRTHLNEPEWGSPGTLGLGLIVFLACGSVLAGPAYLWLLLPYVALCLGILRADDVDRSPLWGLGWRHRSAFAVALLVAGSMTTGLAHGLPRLYDHVNQLLFGWIEKRMSAGFNDGAITLDSLEGMLLSDKIVLRVEGKKIGPLRGNVYNHYANRRWLTVQLGPHEKVQAGARLNPEYATAVIHYASGNLDRFFLPGDVEAVYLSPATGRVDATGLVRPMPKEHPEVAEIHTGTDRKFPIAEPAALDLQVPANLAPTVARLAAEWTAGAKDPEARLELLTEKLERDYTYSLSFSREEDSVDPVDPVIHFLTVDPQGHCEYFAAALAILARSIGIPSRVVTGYRVSEHNPLGDYYIVRERHAHAWVEAYLDDQGWVTVDPSPVRSFEGAAAATTPWASALMDFAVVLIQRHGVTILIVLLVAVFLGIQVWRLLHPEDGTRAASKKEISGPPDYLEALLRRLGNVGLIRGAGESIEAYARRVGARTDKVRARWLVAAERLLLRYAALRYGEIGSTTTLRTEVRGWLDETLW